MREKWQEPNTPVGWKRTIVAEVLEREGVRIEVTPRGRRNRADDEGDPLRILVVAA
jgi:hypothetical protein